MIDFYKNNEYLARALEWIRDNEPDNFVFATVLKSLGMTLEDVNDYLMAFGVDREDRNEIIDALKKGGK